MIDSTEFRKNSESEFETHSRRQHVRTPASGQVVAQVVDSHDELLLGYIFRSPIIEISPCGLRLTTDTQVEGCKLDLWLEIEGHEGKMFLTVGVKWVSMEQPGVYQIGVEVISNPLTDIEEWCEFQRSEWFLQKD